LIVVNNSLSENGAHPDRLLVANSAASAASAPKTVEKDNTRGKAVATDRASANRCAGFQHDFRFNLGQKALDGLSHLIW
jgi:hypothetical protein